MATAQSTHHVVLTLSGTDYGLMVKNYQKQDMTSFAPKIASGNMKWSDGTIYQTLAQEDWSHGYGYREMTDPSGFAYSGDGIDSRFSRKVTLMTKLTDASTMDSGVTACPVKKFVEFGGSVYALMNNGTDGGVVKWDGAEWDLSLAQSGALCIDGMTDGGFLYVTMNGARMKRTADGSTWADCLQATATDMQFIGTAGKYAWVSDDSLSLVHYADHETNLSSALMWEGGDPDSGGDPNAAYVGAGNVPITGLCSWQNSLYVGREDGLWYIPDESVDNYIDARGNGHPPAYKVLNYEKERHPYNFRAMAVWNGALYFTIKNEIWRMTGLTQINVTPQEFMYEYPYWRYGNFRCFTPVGPFLYVLADEDDGATVSGYGNQPYGEGPYGGRSLTTVLLCYDGVGWHRLLELASGTDTVSCMDYTPVNAKLWISIDKGTGADEIYYIPMRGNSNLPYASYEVTTAPPDASDDPHYLFTSLFTAELATVTKHFSALTLQGKFNATRTIDVHYALDGGAWNHLGTFDGGDSETIEFPSTLALCTGMQIAFRLNFQTSNGSTTPVLQRMILQYLPRPATIYTYSFDVYAADKIKKLDRTIDANTAKNLIDALELARASSIPITFYDIWNTSHSVYVTAVNERKIRFESGGTGTPKENEHICSVTLVTATNEGV